jgi:hypothetical protein
MSSDDDQDEQAKAMADPYRQVFSLLSLRNFRHSDPPPPGPTPSLTLRRAKPILCTFSAGEDMGGGEGMFLSLDVYPSCISDLGSRIRIRNTLTMRCLLYLFLFIVADP